MIPIRLKLSGFLSYRDAVEVDFSGFNMACISGHNGAGKSSLLDAFTYALFGQARKTGEALINSASDTAEATLTFDYEGNQYRIQRILARGKSTTLEFQVWDADGERWRPLTERSIRETQAKIEQTLRLDYETFVNASFFLQGKADQFTQQRPGDRKRILASILGLDQWDSYRERTAERRKALEREVDQVDGRLAEINTELSEESDRKERLAELQAQLTEISANREDQKKTFDLLQRMADSMRRERELTDKAAATLERLRTSRDSLSARLQAKQTERELQADLLARAEEVQSAYRAWTESRAALETFDKVAAQFREQEKRRQPFLDEINSERARLEQERVALSDQVSVVSNQLVVIGDLEKEQERAVESLAEAEAKVSQREALRAELDEMRRRQSGLKAENEGLKAQMLAMDERIKNLEVTEAGNCPLCGQELSPEHRAATIDGLKAEGKVFGDQWRANRVETESLAGQVAELEAQFKGFSDAESERVRLAAQLSALEERLETARQAAAAWETGGKIRLQEVENLLNGEKFAAEARSQLSKLDEELAALGYDAAAHDAARQAELVGRGSEAEYRSLEAARAALKPLDDEIGSLNLQLSTLNTELDNAEDAYAEAVARLAEQESQLPDLDDVEAALYRLQEQENRLRNEVGMAVQLVKVLDDRRAQKSQYTARREELAAEIASHKTLERAFGKDGVPALLIEQSLPQIEEKANELLDRLSNGMMSVRFVTQAGYKDKKRDDLKETLDIVISDPAGERDYEMFSGGEAFRVNFAIRLALSEILAQRTGARLQTLVIDEGFGSQDAQGIQRLIEAINTVRGDFAKILIITHLDELKDAFPNRIEVEKDERGSLVRVI
jgi:DNA repair protein SbcC/Rad50